MPYYPQLPSTATYRVTTDQFGGLNRNVRSDDGSFFDMQNMTGDDFPVLSTRRPRVRKIWPSSTPGQSPVTALNNPLGIIAKDALAYLDGTTLWYGGTGYDLNLYIDQTAVPKSLISMGSYIIIWPDKYYFNTLDTNDKGPIEQKNKAESGTITYTMCKQDGTSYGEPTASANPPDEPGDGTYWIDTSGSLHALKQWDAASRQWVEIATTYVKIEADGIGAGLSKYDGISLSGLATSEGDNVDEQIASLNGTVIVYDASDDAIVVVGIIDHTATQTATAQNPVKAERTVPDMDYITEAQNRLWGCKFGIVNGQTVNEIYCCALGDFRNWNQFMGLSTDSWVASQGTDGQWTGAITHLGYPIFMKENCLHKVYISSQGAHQVVTTICRGVQKGSSKSMAIVDEQLYYKARVGIMRYDGSLPVCVSDDLGTDLYYEAVGGAFGKKYFVSMKGTDDEWNLFVYDTTYGFWHREDDLHALGFAKLDDELWVIKADTKELVGLNGISGTDLEPEGQFEWSVTTGIIGLDYPDQKRMYRFNIRLFLEEGDPEPEPEPDEEEELEEEIDPEEEEQEQDALTPPATCVVEVQYDSNGNWIQVSSGSGRGLGNLTIPVIPRRCDHMQIRISGTGQAKIYSFAKILEMSGDKQ